MTANRTTHKLETVSGSVGDQSPEIPLWVCVFILISGFLMVLGGLIALLNPSMLMAPHDDITEGVKIYAGHFAVRNFALGVFLPLLLALRARRTLRSMMVLVGVIQFFDVIMDCVEGRWTIVPGVLLLGVLYLIGAARMARAPFWRRESWT
jgi:hypothetical protein